MILIDLLQQFLQMFPANGIEKIICFHQNIVSPSKYYCCVSKFYEHNYVFLFISYFTVLYYIIIYQRLCIGNSFFVFYRHKWMFKYTLSTWRYLYWWDKWIFLHMFAWLYWTRMSNRYFTIIYFYSRSITV